MGRIKTKNRIAPVITNEIRELRMMPMSKIQIFKAMSEFPPIDFNRGSTIPVVNAVTTFPNAAPMITPTASAIALPLRINSLNSLNMLGN